MNNQNPYLAGLDLVKKHHGTSGQAALAKCILSLYNSDFHGYSIGEIVSPLDATYTRVVFDMVSAYASRGETEELRIAGRWVRDNFPGLCELSAAAFEAKSAVRSRWDREREEEIRRLHPNG